MLPNSSHSATTKGHNTVLEDLCSCKIEHNNERTFASLVVLSSQCTTRHCQGLVCTPSLTTLCLPCTERNMRIGRSPVRVGAFQNPQRASRSVGQDPRRCVKIAMCVKVANVRKTPTYVSILGGLQVIVALVTSLSTTQPTPSDVTHWWTAYS